jgi:hypothetical protein
LVHLCATGKFAARCALDDAGGFDPRDTWERSVFGDTLPEVQFGSIESECLDFDQDLTRRGFRDGNVADA